MVSFVLSCIYKFLKLMLKIFARLLVTFGLWIAALFTVGFFAAMLIQGWTWADVGGYYYMGLGISLFLGFLWFCRFKLGIGRPKKSKDNDKSKDEDEDEDDRHRQKQK